MDRYRSGHNGPDSKSGSRASGSWVRIPPYPPEMRLPHGSLILHKGIRTRGHLETCRRHVSTRGGLRRSAGRIPPYPPKITPAVGFFRLPAFLFQFAAKSKPFLNLLCENTVCRKQRGAAVFDALRHGVIFHPDDAIAQISAVIAERVIRRGRHTAMNAVIRQLFQDFEAIAGVNDVKLYGGVPPCLLY